MKSLPGNECASLRCLTNFAYRCGRFQPIQQRASNLSHGLEMRYPGGSESQLMAEVTPKEAVRVLERFRDEAVRVCLTGMGFGWSLGLEGRVAEVSSEEVKFAIPGGGAVLALRLDMDDLQFWSGDVSDLPAQLGRGIVHLKASPAFVGIALPYRVFPDMLAGPACSHELRPRERIFFCELPPSG
jgi:hypothetical protein